MAGYAACNSQPHWLPTASYLALENPMQSYRSRLTRPVSFSIVLLLLFGYALMGCMMAEQNRTISAQRDLIHKLFQDSVRLAVAQANAKQASHR